MYGYIYIHVCMSVYVVYTCIGICLWFCLLSLPQEVERSPCGLLDLLAACWMQEAILRPSAAAVIKIVSSTQFLHLWDAVSLASECHILCSASIHNCGQSPGMIHPVS